MASSRTPTNTVKPRPTRAIERRTIGTDVSLALQALHPAQARRRRQADLLRQLDVGQPAVRLERGDDLVVESVQRLVWHDSLPEGILAQNGA